MDETMVAYRTCFGTDSGKRVLGQILMDSGYFDADIKTEGEIAVQNFAKGIVKKLGICNDPKDVGFYVQKLFELPSKQEGYTMAKKIKVKAKKVKKPVKQVKKGKYQKGF